MQCLFFSLSFSFSFYSPYFSPFFLFHFLLSLGLEKELWWLVGKGFCAGTATLGSCGNADVFTSFARLAYHFSLGCPHEGKISIRPKASRINGQIADP